MVEGGLEAGRAAGASTGSPCLLYTTTPAGRAPHDRDLVTWLLTCCCRAREAREADREAAASDRGSVELRGWDLLAARRGSVRGGWCGSCCCAAVWMTGDSA